MAYFYYKINQDFSISDNIKCDQSGNWNKLQRMTSVKDMYCVHILSGSCRLDVNGHEVELRERDFIVFMQGCFIRHINYADDVEFYCLSIEAAKLHTLFEEVGFNLATRERINKYYKVQCSEEHHSLQLSHYQSLKKRILSGNIFDYSLALRFFEAVLLQDMELYRLENPDILQPPSRKEQVFYEFMKLVETHFLRERKLVFYARALGLTPKYLSAVIKEVSGCHFTYWIDEPLITEAKKILYYTDKSVKEISSELGFLDQSKFGRFFKNITGMSPSMFRTNEEN